MASHADIPLRQLGNTGEMVSSIGLGGAHIGSPEVTPREAVRLIRQAVDRGVTFMDNCWDYNGGRSELLMGKALRDGYRKRVFLMTKFDGRTKKEALRQIDESLKRLRTQHLDLLQFHENIRFDDPDRFFAVGGAAEALLQAKKAGKTRYIGFTGHKDPHVHLYMLELAKRHGFHFDTVQMPINVMDAHFRSFGKLVLPEARRQGLAILGMKSMGSGVILKSKRVKPEDCMRYALSQPISVLITGIDSQKILDQACRVAADFRPMSRAEMAKVLRAAAPDAQAGEFELFKTSSHFDSTAKNPAWLGGESDRVRQLSR